MAIYPAIFLDRDGTLIEDVGYIKSISDVRFFPDSFDSLRQLQQHFLLFIITNQSGIAKGLTTTDEVNQVNNYILSRLKEQNIYIREIFCCPHDTGDNCSCKKPHPYFIHQAAESYGLDLDHSYILGDHPSDAGCGINAGIHPVYLLTGHGQKHLHELHSDVRVCGNLSEATKFILNLITDQND